MKLLIVTSLNEHRKKVAKILEEAKVAVFSITETIGFKGNSAQNLADGWFATGGDQFDSVFLFSFTDDENASNALKLIGKYNDSNECKFPIRAFIVPVESASY